MKAVKKSKTNNRKMITFQQEDHTLTIEMNREIGNTDLSLWVEDDKLITFRAGNREMTEHLDSLTEVTKENDIKIEWYIDRITIYFGRMKAAIQCDYVNKKVYFRNCLQEFVEIKGISIKLIREFVKILDVELPEED
jgi:hypothetical protein